MKPQMARAAVQAADQPRPAPPAQMLIDRYLPVFDVTRLEHTVIEAEPE